MGLRIRKSYNLGGGFRINVSGSGVGYSWGGKGYRVTHMANGRTRRTATIPGTGISNTKTYSTKKIKQKAQSGCATMLLSLIGLIVLLLVFILL